MLKSSILSMKFIGTVVNVLPPGVQLPDGKISRITRFQCRIPALHDKLPDNQLPYYLLMKSVFRGSSHGVGEFNYPRVNSKVVIEFDGEELRSGYIVGELQDAFNPPPASWLDGSGNLLYYGSVDEKGNSHKTEISSGDITIDTVGNYTLNIPSGKTFTITCGSSSIVMTNNKITITAATIENDASTVLKATTPSATFSQDVTVTGTTSSGKVDATSSLKVGPEEMLNHKHHYTDNGNLMTTGTPI